MNQRQGYELQLRKGQNIFNYIRQREYDSKFIFTKKNCIDLQCAYCGVINEWDMHSDDCECRRERVRDMYIKLQILVERYDVRLSRNFSFDSDLNEMEIEYLKHIKRIIFLSSFMSLVTLDYDN